MKSQTLFKSSSRGRLASLLSIANVCFVLIMLGAILFSTLVLYPNIFKNPPQSLEQAMQFLTEASPGTFFPPFGGLTVATGIARIVAVWPLKQVRLWVVSSVLLFLLGDGLLSILYFWPQNTIMFIEGRSLHSASKLIEIAANFQQKHWIRVVVNGVAAALSFKGLMVLERELLIARCFGLLRDRPRISQES